MTKSTANGRGQRKALQEQILRQYAETHDLGNSHMSDLERRNQEVRKAKKIILKKNIKDQVDMGKKIEKLQKDNQS